MKRSILSGFIAAILAVPAVDAGQTIYVTNLLDNLADSFPARTQTPVKLDAYQGGKICYTVASLAFGNMYQFAASPTDPNCLYISQIVVTPLPIAKIQIYGPSSIAIGIAGGASQFQQITIIQQTGANSSPIFNPDGTVTPGVMSYQTGVGFSAKPQ